MKNFFFSISLLMCLHVSIAKNNTLFTEINFTEIFQINAVSSPEQAGTISGTGFYNDGETCELIAHSAVDYVFNGWFEDESLISSDTILVFTVSSNRNIKAVYTCKSLLSPGLISGPSMLNPGTIANYSISAVSNASSYIWTYTGNAVLTNTVNVLQLIPYSSGKLSVFAQNSCSRSDSVHLNIRVEAFQQKSFQVEKGFTWLSINLGTENWQINNVLNSISPCLNNRIIGQAGFAIFYNGSWLGALSSLNPFKMYTIELCNQDTLHLSGLPVESSTISLSSGYTWIGYTPQSCLSVNLALSGLTPVPSENDRIIGQNSFAVYHNGMWLGSLTNICPYKGYIIFLSKNSTLRYPDLPKVKTLMTEEVSNDAATCQADVFDDGGLPIIERGFFWDTITDPDLNRNMGIVVEGGGSGVFSSEIIFLSPEKIYYYRAYAKNQLGISYGMTESFLTFPLGFICGISRVYDVDDNVYKTVLINSKCWLRNNLKVSRYRDGSLIPYINETSTWLDQAGTDKRCYYNNSQSKNALYGTLYNWYAFANNKGICPEGWHIPDAEEWQEMFQCYGGMELAGGKLKSTSNWNLPNIDATNVSRFSALPGGLRNQTNGEFSQIGAEGRWWSSEEYFNNFANVVILTNSSAGVNYTISNKNIGCSVRCVMD